MVTRIMGVGNAGYARGVPEGTRLFDDVPKSYRLNLVSNTASSNGILELQYSRHS